MKVNLNSKSDCQDYPSLWLCFWVGEGAFPWARDNKICSFTQPQLWRTISVGYSSHGACQATKTKTFSVLSLWVNFPLMYLELFLLFFIWLNMKMPGSNKIFSLPYSTVSSIALTLSDKFMWKIFSSSILLWAAIMCIFRLSGVI